MEKIKVFEIEIDGVKKSISNLGDVTDALKLINKESKKADFGTEKFNALQRQLGTLKQVQKDFRDDVKATGREFEATKYPTDSLRGLELQYIKTRQRIKELSKEERESDFGKKLVASAAATKDELNRLNLEMNDGRTNVGLYTKSILEAVNTQNGLVASLNALETEFKQLPKAIQESTAAQDSYNESVQELKTEIDTLSTQTGKKFEDFQDSTIDKLGQSEGAVGDFVKGIKGLGKSLRVLLANPVIAFLAFVAAALGAVFKAFGATERGAALMAKAQGILNGLWSEFVGFVDAGVTALISFTEDPIEGLKNLGKAIVDNVINRFEAVIEIVGLTIDALFNLATFDFDGLAENADKAGAAITKLTTGLDAEQQQEFVDALKNSGNEILKVADAFGVLATSRREVQKQNRLLIVQLERLTTQEAILSSVADDTTQSFLKREEAAAEAAAARELQGAKEIEIANNNLSLIDQEIALRRSNGENVEALADQQIAALQAVLQAERELVIGVADNERRIRELKRDRLERDLDILLDGFDNQKTINERIINDERNTLDERIALKKETDELSDTSFDAQIKTLQEFTGIRIEANDLLNESDAVALNARIRALGLDEIIEGRLLEVIRDRRTAVQDLIEVQQDLDDAIIAQAGDDLEAERNNALINLINTSKAAAETISFQREIIEKDSAIRSLNQRLEIEELSAKESSEVRLKILEEEEAKKVLIAENALKSELDTIEKAGLLRVSALDQDVENQKGYQATRKALELETEIAILEARINATEQGSTEQLALIQDLEDKRVQAAVAANELIKATDKSRVDSLKAILGELSGVTNATNQIFQNISAAQLNKVEERFARELELAEGNASEEERINAELDAAKAKIERKAFDRQKKIQAATATISYLQGLINLASAPSIIPQPFSAIFKGLQAALLTGIYTSNLSRINSTSFGEKGLLIAQETSRKMATGGSIKMGSMARGRSHGMGGIHGILNGKSVEIENKEFVDKDEFGNIAVINKKNSQRFKGPLARMAGKQFLGKSAILSGINSFGGNGISFAAHGALVPNLSGAFSGRSGGSQLINTTVEFSQLQLEEIKNAVAIGAAVGSKEGTAIGNIEANRELEREERLNAITG